MDWVILFSVSWSIFIVLKGWKNFKTTVWSGITASALQLMIDTNAMSHHAYKINRAIIPILGSSGFFVLGPVFVIGVLMSKYHPKKRWMRIVNVFVLSALYSSQELLLLATKALEYTDWHFFDSVIVNTAAITILSWFNIVVLNKNHDAGT